jgi:hypothetical protein
MSQVFGALAPSQLPPKVTCKVTLARYGGPNATASERNATTCGFTEWLRQLTHDVRVIELAVAAACKYPDAEEQSL